MKEPLTAKQAADLLGVNASRIRQFILEGRLPATKFGRAWMIEKKDLEKVKDRKPGRPGSGIRLKKRDNRVVIFFRDPHGHRRQITLPKGTTKVKARQIVRKIEKEISPE